MASRRTVVVKYGGSSFRNTSAFVEAAAYLLGLDGEGYLPVAVVSAPKGVSDMLIEAYEGRTSPDELRGRLETMYDGLSSSRLRHELDRMSSLLKERGPENRDEILSLGENHSGIMLSEMIETMGINSEYMDGAAAGVAMINSGSRSRVDVRESVRQMKAWYSFRGIPVVGGYVGCADSRYVLIGRNSTDITMALVGEAFDALRCENIKDTAVLRVQPKIELNGGKPIEIKTGEIPELSYDESIHMGWRQSEVVHPFAVSLASGQSRPIIVKQLGKGGSTLISEKSGTTNERPVAALSVRPCYILRVNDPVMDTPDGIGYLSAVSDVFEQRGVNILDMTGPGTTMSFMFPTRQNKTNVDVDGLTAAMEERLRERGFYPRSVSVSERCAISIVGDAMGGGAEEGSPGMLRRLAKPFEDAGVSIRMLSQADEIEANPLVDVFIDNNRDNAERVIRAFCDEFGFTK